MLINRYTKQGVLSGVPVETDLFDLAIGVKSSSVPGLVQLGQSRGLNPATFYPAYVLKGDLP